MTEAEWTADDEPAPKKKKLIPTWVMIGCGGGCLVMLVVIGAIAAFGWKIAQDVGDPEKSWEGLTTHLPCDERPEGWVANGFEIMGNGTFNLTIPNDSPLFDTPEEEDIRASMLVQSFGMRQSLDDLMDPESTANRGVLGGVGKIEDAEEGTIEIQGREVRCLRFKAYVPDMAMDEGDTAPTSIRVDVTGDSKDFAVVMVVLREGERVSDALVQQLLSPFDVWRE